MLLHWFGAIGITLIKPINSNYLAGRFGKALPNFDAVIVLAVKDSNGWTWISYRNLSTLAFSQNSTQISNF